MKKIVFLIALFYTSIIYADTIKLQDNSLITGKIITKQGQDILFANSNGTFKVNMKFIKKIHTTSSYEEDIDIYRSSGKVENTETIKQHYTKGLEKKNKLTKIFGDYDGDLEGGLNPESEGNYRNKKRRKVKKEKMGYHGDWTYGRLSFSMTYFTTLLSELSVTKNVNEVLPSGISVNLSYVQGLEFQKHSMYIPGIKLSHSYFYFTKSLFINNRKEIQGHDANLGLVWALPGLNSKKGYFTIFILPGASMIFINNRNSNKKVITTTFSLKTGMGYEVRVHDKVFLQFHFNYNYLIDTKVSFNSIGGSFGMAFKLW